MQAYFEKKSTFSIEHVDALATTIENNKIKQLNKKI